MEAATSSTEVLGVGGKVRQRKAEKEEKRRERRKREMMAIEREDKEKGRNGGEEKREKVKYLREKKRSGECHLVSLHDKGVRTLKRKKEDERILKG